jgi:hypothetical protein
MELSRKATAQEEKLLDLLISKSSKPILPVNWKDTLSVHVMEDGNMGSLRLQESGRTLTDRKFGEQVSEHQFVDSDGVMVIASLYLDTDGYLYELDMWKVDFTPVAGLQV